MHCCRGGSSNSCPIISARQLPFAKRTVTQPPHFLAPLNWRSCAKKIQRTKLSSAPTDTEASNTGFPLPFSPPPSPQDSPLPAGKCWLAGVGPGSWDHVTVKVAKLVTAADVLVYDDLGAQELLDAAPPWAEKVYVGKRGGATSIKQTEIDKLLVELCKQGKRVVRLKGGCPSTFSRVSSEAAALAAAGCPFDMVPGVSTATAAAVLAGFPLTDAKLAGGYAVVSAHEPNNIDWVAFRLIPTLVILMGGRALELIVQHLLAAGWSEDTPVAVIKAAGTSHQQEWTSTLARVVKATQPGAPLSPCIIVVGQVASLPATWQRG